MTRDTPRKRLAIGRNNAADGLAENIRQSPSLATLAEVPLAASEEKGRAARSYRVSALVRAPATRDFDTPLDLTGRRSSFRGRTLSKILSKTRRRSRPALERPSAQTRMAARCRRWESNPHGTLAPLDFESSASASSATSAHAKSNVGSRSCDFRRLGKTAFLPSFTSLSQEEGGDQRLPI
jgi:hypothetical protein